MNDAHTTNWRDTLAHWLLQHSPLQTEADRQLRMEFVERFPAEKLGQMTLEQYAGGKPDGFCYWLEYQTLELGSIKGGNSAKLGVWWSKSENQWRWNKIYASAEDAWERLRAGLVALVRAAEQGHLESLDEIGDEHLDQAVIHSVGNLCTCTFPTRFCQSQIPIISDISSPLFSKTRKGTCFHSTVSSSATYALCLSMGSSIVSR